MKGIYFVKGNKDEEVPQKCHEREENVDFRKKSDCCHIYLPMMARKLGLQMFLFAFQMLLKLWSASSVSTFLWV